METSPEEAAKLMIVSPTKLSLPERTPKKDHRNKVSTRPSSAWNALWNRDRIC